MDRRWQFKDRNPIDEIGPWPSPEGYSMNIRPNLRDTCFRKQIIWRVVTLKTDGYTYQSTKELQWYWRLPLGNTKSEQIKNQIFRRLTKCRICHCLGSKVVKWKDTKVTFTTISLPVRGPLDDYRGFTVAVSPPLFTLLVGPIDVF